LPIFAPHLYTSQDVFRFGTVETGTLVRGQFTVRNLHPWSVTVTGVRGGCGCIKSFVGRKPPFKLKPFESVQVNALLDTSNRPGTLKQSIYVVTSDFPRGTELIISGIAENISQSPNQQKEKVK
jgi:hypothetical protein